MAADPEHPYVSRGGLKLAHAIETFGIDVRGAVCADLGCSTGGFTDCLLRHGAAHVFAVDTAYGQFAWKLRQDDRVTVLERTNAIHLEPVPASGIDLVVIDLGWTRQSHAIPAALRWRPRRILSLIKPHYERPRDRRRKDILEADEAQSICDQVLATMPEWGAAVLGCVPSPILGGGSRRKKGNREYLAWLQPLDSAPV